MPTIKMLDATMKLECSGVSKDANRLVVFGGRGVAVLFLILSILHAGRQLEQWQVRQLPDTSHLYQTEQVCALHLPSGYSVSFLNRTGTGGNLLVSESVKGNRTGQLLPEGMEITYFSLDPVKLDQPPLTSTTYKSAELVKSQGSIVQHCGECGQCSNPQDIAIYDKTKDTLFKSSLQCAVTALLQGRDSAHDCLEKSVGFTESCNDCWVDNMMCTIRSCMFTCAWTSLFSTIKVNSATGDAPQQLNECLKCDEKRCGPAFLQCAGANRRRVGINSDIQRDHREECKVVDDAWWKSESLQQYYQQTKTAGVSTTVA